MRPSDNRAFDTTVAFFIVYDDAPRLDFETMYTEIGVSEIKHLGQFPKLHEFSIRIECSGHELATES